jgi:hypothetical protein
MWQHVVCVCVCVCVCACVYIYIIVVVMHYLEIATVFFMTVYWINISIARRTQRMYHLKLSNVEFDRYFSTIRAIVKLLKKDSFLLSCRVTFSVTALVSNEV